MTRTTPVITVGLPVAAEPETYVRQAVQSVLNQTFVDWELIIIADGSPPAMVQFLRSFADSRIRVIAHNDSAGLAARLNEIASVARGEFLARFDADDIMMPQRLDHQLRTLRGSAADLISGRAIVIDQSGEIVAETRAATEHVPVESMFAATPLIHPTVFAGTAWFRTHPYDESLLRCQDKALWITSSADSTIVRDPEPVLFYRVSSDLNPNKYASSARFERVIIRRYGPEIIGRVATVSLTVKGWLKQQLIRLASALGRGEAIMRRRYAPLDREEARAWKEILQGALRATDSVYPTTEEKP